MSENVSPLGSSFAAPGGVAVLTHGACKMFPGTSILQLVACGFKLDEACCLSLEACGSYLDCL